MEFMLQIIPVIDIRGGIVVHARGGNRQLYPALESVLTASVEPAEVIADLLALLPFERFYIADLDAIEQGTEQTALYRSLSRQFPQTEFWIDSGFRGDEALKADHKSDNLRWVAGSETLIDTAMLMQPELASRLILSLDKKNNTQLGQAELFSESQLWTNAVILMNLDRVGANRGPDLAWLQTQLSVTRKVKWYLAGGIRDEADLMAAEQNGATGVLIASALHTGAISVQTLKRLMQ